MEIGGGGCLIIEDKMSFEQLVQAIGNFGSYNDKFFCFLALVISVQYSWDKKNKILSA